MKKEKEVKKEEKTKKVVPAKNEKSTAAKPVKAAKADAKKADVKKAEEKKVETKEVEEKEVSLGKYVVVFDKEEKLWKIKRDNAKRVIASYATKKDAMTRVKTLCENNDAGVVVKKKNGQFQKKKNIRI